MIMPFRKIRRVIFRRFQIDTTLCHSESLVSNGVWQLGHSFNRTVVKLLAFSALLVTLVGLVWQVPILWELALVALIGATYWIFFRTPADSE